VSGAASRRVRGLVAVVAVLGLGLTGCDGGQPSADPSSPDAASATESALPPPPPRAAKAPRPDVGACYRLGYDDALAPTTGARPVPCKRGHTAVTYFVGTLDTVVDGHLLQVDAARVRAQAAEACPRRLPAYLGGGEREQRLSVLRGVWFSPTLEQSDEGQDWFRCDVISLADGESLNRLDVDPRRALATAAGRATYGVCGTAEPGTAGFRRVPCSEEHRWEAVTSYDVTGTAYPGRDALRRLADDQCRQVGKERADDPLTYRWGFDYPTQDQWKAGVHYGLCWVPS
jgi:Septum formation